jgi:hypothetical protein
MQDAKDFEKQAKPDFQNPAGSGNPLPSPLAFS